MYMYIYCMYVELKLCILIITSFSNIYGISDDIILMSPCPRLFGCSGNGQVVESPVVLVTWRRGGVVVNRQFFHSIWGGGFIYHNVVTKLPHTHWPTMFNILPIHNYITDILCICSVVV